MTFFEQIAQEIIIGSAHEVLLKLEAQVILDRCYQTLLKIHEVLENPAEDDAACFEKIEQIVREYEKLGVYTVRHDFG